VNCITASPDAWDIHVDENDTIYAFEDEMFHLCPKTVLSMIQTYLAQIHLATTITSDS
jgi:hypothetical protein